ncbi:hypothetical protein [Roseisalinus antarcticus]|uniref:hypothetical protein n=1 Tax=Roseisalinus antarcticus TaxID=254357 RepID=UPI002285A4D5|nr:hypothetical protein [Roseisalinus antarcticus]
MGNCMLCTQIGVEPEFDQSAAYVEGWLEAMKEIEISRLLSFGKLCCNVRSTRQWETRVETAFRSQTGLRQSRRVQGPIPRPPVSGRSERYRYTELPRRASG